MTRRSERTIPDLSRDGATGREVPSPPVAGEGRSPSGSGDVVGPGRVLVGARVGRVESFSVPSQRSDLRRFLVFRHGVVCLLLSRVDFVKVEVKISSPCVILPHNEVPKIGIGNYDGP